MRLLCVPDEESEDVTHRSTDALVAEGLRADFALTGEPTDLHIGVQAKGVLAVRVEVQGTSAHGSTPVARATTRSSRPSTSSAASRPCPSAASPRTSSTARRSTSRASSGGDAFNKVPDVCTMDVDIRYLPNQDPGEILGQVRAIGDLEILRQFIRAPAIVSRRNPYVLRPARRGRPLDRGRRALRGA